MSAHPYRSSTLKAVLKLSWRTQLSYQLPGGPIRVRMNRPGLIEPILGLPVKRKGDSTQKVSVRDILYLHQDARSGWLVSRRGMLRARSRTRHEFARRLIGEVRALLIERFLGAVVLPGRVVRAGKRTTLELEVDYTTSEPDAEPTLAFTPEITPLVILVPQGSIAGRISARLSRVVRMQFFDASVPRPDRVVVREKLPKGARIVRRKMDSTEGSSRILAAPLSWGKVPEPGFNLVLDLISSCPEFVWVGRDGRSAVDMGDLLEQPDEAGTVHPATEGPNPEMAEGIAFHRVAGQCVVFAPSLLRPLLLDPQAEAILRLCDGRTPVEEIADVAAEVFGTDRAEIEHKLAALISAMVSAGFLKAKRDENAERMSEALARAASAGFGN